MLQFFAHPFSSYCQKVLVALYENGTPFEWRRVDDAGVMDELAARWPFKLFPILVDGDATIVEATVIIEHLGIHHPGPVALLPADPAAALDVRALDRFFDNYVMTPQQKIVFDSIREPGDRDAMGVTQARAMLETAYTWLDLHMADREWASGDFSLADCAAAPALFYADWTHAIAERFTKVHAYRRRLLARPSFARAIDEARPFRYYFPLGAPDRD